jgi:uncharacterized membrane protein
MHWLRRSFIAGFFVAVPLIISVAALVWVFNVIDGFMGPIYFRWLKREVPGLGLATTALLVLLVGVLANNVISKRLVQRAETLLQRVPVFGMIYGPIKQLLAAFSPDNEGGFKRVVLAECPDGRIALGFLTREFTVDRGQGPERLIAVFVPTNHLYLGDVMVFRERAVSYPDITVEEGIRIFLTAGMAIASRVELTQKDNGPAATPTPFEPRGPDGPARMPGQRS